MDCGALEMLHWWENPIVIEMLNVGFDTNILNEEESEINMQILIVTKE